MHASTRSAHAVLLDIFCGLWTYSCVHTLFNIRGLWT